MKVKEVMKKILEELAIRVAVNDTKMVCPFISYQPKLPEAVKKLKK